MSFSHSEHTWGRSLEVNNNNNDQVNTVSNNNNVAEAILRATIFAAHKHRDQRRKDAARSPYIVHPIHVAHLLSSCGVNDLKVLTAALWHDTLEDTKCSYEELVQQYGLKDAADIVQECTDDKKQEKVARKRLQIEHAKHASTEAKLVKLADKYSNLSDLASNPPAHWSPEEIQGYAYWSFAVVKQCCGVNDKLENMLLELFQKTWNIDPNTDVESEEFKNHLEQYYKKIDKSE